MILKAIFTILFFITTLHSLTTTSDDEYKVFETKTYTIIYTNTNKSEAIKIKNNLDSYLANMDNSFGFSFDEPIYISLISTNIELANAFSTQTPHNQTLFYGGGVQYIDYFSSKSWLDLLLYHEISHNYQINSKNNVISKSLHSFLGNNYLPIFIPIPFFTLPNLLIPTALLEGNSVLNESIHQNGGRLYNGRFKALTNLLVLENKMDKTIFINDHLDFPYIQEKYIVGGYFMLYLSNIYGVDKVNRYYQQHSKHFINPLLLNDTFKKHFQISFDKSFKNFINHIKQKAKNFKALKNSNFLSSSKNEIYLSKQNSQILFLTSDKKNKTKLNLYNIETNNIKKHSGNWLNGKVFKIDNNFYSSSQAYINSTLYKNGLFDKNRYIKEDTKGGVIQDIFENNYLYFDVKNSFDTPSLYLNGVFFDKANSSALFDKKGNIYYFKQEGKNRALYKGKKSVFSFKGYFSKLADILDNTIYFIANSKDGSTLYKYDNKIKKVSTFDNIVDAKIIDKNSALVVTINHNNYRVYKIALKDIKEKVSTTTIVNDKKTPFKINYKNLKNQSINSIDYNELKELKFSYLYPTFSYSSDDGVLYTLEGYFLDPLMLNMFSLYAYKLEDERYAGINYINERYIPFELNLYDSKIDDPSYSNRGYGGYLSIYGPLYKAGAHQIDMKLKKYFDDENEHKSPLLFTTSHNYELNFGGTFKPYFSSDLQTYLKEDRDDTTYGGSVDISHHIYKESFIDASIRVLKSDTENLIAQRGIKIYRQALTSIDDSDTYAPGIDNDFFVKEITKSSIGLSKTINLNRYFFTFPLSLRREHIYFRYSDYEYKQTDKRSFNEKTFGITFDTLLVHKIPIPIDIKYIENSVSKDDYKVVLNVGVEF